MKEGLEGTLTSINCIGDAEKGIHSAELIL